MLSWFGKSSSKKGSSHKKKSKSKDNSFFDALSSSLRRHKRNPSSRTGSDSDLDGSFSASISASTSASVTRCQSFSHGHGPGPGLPLPVPGAAQGLMMGRTESGLSYRTVESGLSYRTVKSGERSGRISSNLLPLPSPEQVRKRLESADGAAAGGCGSDSPTSSLGSDDHRDRDLISNATSFLHAGVICNHGKKNKRNEQSKPNGQYNVNLVSKQNLPIAPKKGFSSSREKAPKHLQIPVNRIIGNATDSSLSSPTSPMKAVTSEHGANGYVGPGVTFGSGNCSSPGSGQNSGQNSMGGDMVAQHFTRGNSPVLSPRMRSPGPSSRGQSVAVSPLHPRAGGLGPESPTGRQEEGKPLCHPLPLPPRSPCNFTTCSTGPRSPGGKDNPTSPGTRWKKGKLLGRGTFGNVYAGFSNESGEMCAMKEVTLFSEDAKSKESVKQLGQEVVLLSQLRHPNIVQYFGSETVDGMLYIYLEYVSGGSIHKLLQEYGQFGEPVVRSYTAQILAGLAYLHNRNTVHRDIKGANILVDPNGQVKLADFGMAKHITAHSFPLSFKGSPYWMAPEVIKNSNGYDLAVDIWSLGCTVLEMATAQPPWSQYEGVAAMFKIGNSKELPSIPDHLSEEGKSFVKLCLQRNPALRPTAAQLLEHPFVKNAAPFVKLDHGTKSMETETLSSSANGMRPLNSTQYPAQTRDFSSVELEYSTQQSRIWPPYQPSSDQHMQKNISLPVSPSASPLIHSRSSHPRYGGMSPSPVGTPIVRSGSSTPLSGGYGAIPFQANGVARHTVYVQENFANAPKLMNGLHGPLPTCSGGYADSRPDVNGGAQAVRTPEGSPRPTNHLGAESDILGKTYCRVMRNENGQSQRHYNGQGAFEEHLPQQHLKASSQLIGFDLRPVSPLLGRANGHEYY